MKSKTEIDAEIAALEDERDRVNQAGLVVEFFEITGQIRVKRDELTEAYAWALSNPDEAHQAGDAADQQLTEGRPG